MLLLCREEQMPYYILGNGSNLLVSDKGYGGVMILMGRDSRRSGRMYPANWRPGPEPSIQNRQRGAGAFPDRL